MLCAPRSDQLVELMHSRARRRFSHGLKRKPLALIKKLRKAKKEAPVNEKPAIVKTHLRNMIVVPEMVGSIVGVYNGKTFNQVSLWMPGVFSVFFVKCIMMRLDDETEAFPSLCGFGPRIFRTDEAPMGTHSRRYFITECFDVQNVHKHKLF